MRSAVDEGRIGDDDGDDDDDDGPLSALVGNEEEGVIAEVGSRVVEVVENSMVTGSEIVEVGPSDVVVELHDISWRLSVKLESNLRKR